MTAPDGSSFLYTYDSMGRISSIVPGETEADSFTAPNGSALDGTKWTSQWPARVPLPPFSRTRPRSPSRITHRRGHADRRAPAPADSDITLKYAFADNVNTGKLDVRLRAATNYYFVEILNTSSTITLYRKVGSVTTALGTLTGWWIPRSTRCDSVCRDAALPSALDPTPPSRRRGTCKRPTAPSRSRVRRRSSRRHRERRHGSMDDASTTI